jgi:hypothetical protein
MNKINRIADPLQGPPDGIEADIKCVVTKFKRPKKKDMQKTIESQAVMDCGVLCAYSDGTIGFSMRDIDLMITVRVDELFEILKEASAAAQELQASINDGNTDNRK